MSSLKEALPDPESPAAFLDNLSETWFPQNSITTYIPSVPQGEFWMTKLNKSQETHHSINVS